MFEKYLNFKLYVLYDIVINLFIVNSASFLSKNPPDANQSILPVLKEGIRLKSTYITFALTVFFFKNVVIFKENFKVICTIDASIFKTEKKKKYFVQQRKLSPLTLAGASNSRITSPLTTCLG